MGLLPDALFQVAFVHQACCRIAACEIARCAVADLPARAFIAMYTTGGAQVPLTDPALQRRKLRDQLRRLRESAGFTQREVANEMEWSLSKLIRIESGRNGISITDLKALIAHYQVTDRALVDRLTAMARAARERPWWDRYRDSAPPTFLLLLGYEGSASIIRTFEPILVPGLLQTEEYAHEVLRLTSPPEKVDERSELRLERQERLLRSDGPQMHFILDENAISRVVGGPDVMRRQVKRLKELTDHPQITLRVLPFTQGLYRYFRNSYVLFEFEDPEEDIVLYAERPNGDAIVREGVDWVEDEAPARFLETFFDMEQLASAEGAPSVLDFAMSRLAAMIPAEPDLSDSAEGVA
ncbi:helix-turn-helix domain-containing protein [Streptomyces sp. NPDC058464]|uniref:helix-turn-helix domain-containing protein n=1 Tax=Streptomyces sp. NPDC058464 TaxID=3346511 RepID=UPI00365F1BCB